MTTWVCATCGPVPAGEIRHLDHNSPHGHETHECGSSAGLDWTKTKEHDMTPDQYRTHQINLLASRAVDTAMAYGHAERNHGTGQDDYRAIAQERLDKLTAIINELRDLALTDTAAPEHLPLDLGEPARDPGPTHRAPSSGRPAFDIARDLRRWADVVGPSGFGELAAEAANKLERLTFRLAEECTARNVAQAWLDLALPFLRDGALAEHHGQCGEAGQYDIRRCEDAHCTERAGLLELFGLLPKEWGAYLATPAAPGGPGRGETDEVTA